MSGETKAPPKQPAPGIGATVGYPSDHNVVYDKVDPQAPDAVKFTLNGKEVFGRRGESILEVCEREGTYVPHYCWHPALSVAGNCRLCLVEVEKVPKPVISCQTHIMPDMVVKTDSELAKSCQEGMMEFLLVNHPLDCPICDRGGECQLQRYSMEYGLDTTRMADKKRKFIKPQADPLIDIERNRCIMCTRCVRFCDEVGGEHVMGAFDRGNGTYIGTFGQGPVSNIFSGNVIDLCPVGCLTSKPYRFKARPWELRQTQSTCSMCSSGCKVTYWTRNGRLYRTTPPSRHRHDHFTINEDTVEFICNEGRFGSDYSQHEGRADEHMVKRGGSLSPTTYEEATKTAAEALKDVIAKHGAQSVAVLVSPMATLEEGFLARNLAKEVIGTPNVDWRSSFANTAAANAVSRALAAADGDLQAHPGALVVVNGNPVAQSPVLALQLQELARRFDIPTVMIGHHHDAYIGAHATMAFHCELGKTGDALRALAGAIAEGGSADGLGGLLAPVGDASVDSLVDLLKNTANGLLVHGLEDYAGAYAPLEVPAAVGLRRALARDWGYLPVVGGRNAVGLHAAGVEPDAEGLAATGVLAAIAEGKVKGLLTVGTDALLNLRDQKGLAAAIDKLDAFVTIDLFRSDINDRADVYLAQTAQIENDGVYADIQGNLALLKQAEEPQGDARPARQILTTLGRLLGAETFGHMDAEEAWAAVRAVIAPDSSITLRHLEIEGSSNDASYHTVGTRGGARTRAKRFNPGNFRDDGLQLRRLDGADADQPMDYQAPAVPAGDGPILVWGPHVSGKGYIANRAAIADILAPKPWLEVNRTDAARLGVAVDHFAIVSIEDKRAKVGVKINDGPAPGTVYLSAGTAGPFDAAAFPGPVRVKIEGLAEAVPDQGKAITDEDEKAAIGSDPTER